MKISEIKKSLNDTCPACSHKPLAYGLKIITPNSTITCHDYNQITCDTQYFPCVAIHCAFNREHFWISANSINYNNFIPDKMKIRTNVIKVKNFSDVQKNLLLI